MADRPYETRRNTAARVEIREDGEGFTLDGYASTYDQPYAVGYFDEQVAKTAFARTMGRNPDVRLLVDHEGQPLARTTSGTLTLDHRNDKGFRALSPLDPSDPDVQRLAPKMRRRDMNEMSFAFRLMDGGDTWDYSGDRPMRTLRHVDMHGGDVSVVTYPANSGTFASLRADIGRQEAGWTLADAMLGDVRRGRAFDKANLRHLHGALDGLGLTLREVQDVESLRFLRNQWDSVRTLAIDVFREVQEGREIDPGRLQRVLDELQGADTALDGSLAAISDMLNVPNEDEQQDAEMDDAGIRSAEAAPEQPTGTPSDLARRLAEADESRKLRRRLA